MAQMRSNMAAITKYPIFTHISNTIHIIATIRPNLYRDYYTIHAYFITIHAHSVKGRLFHFTRRQGRLVKWNGTIYLSPHDNIFTIITHSHIIFVYYTIVRKRKTHTSTVPTLPASLAPPPSNTKFSKGKSYPWKCLSSLSLKIDTLFSAIIVGVIVGPIWWHCCKEKKDTN